MKKTLTILGATAITAMTMTGCSAGEDSTPKIASQEPVLSDGTWLSASIDEVGGDPGTVLHQKKLVVDGTAVRISEIACDGEETSVAAGSVEGGRLTITEAGENNGFGTPGAQVAVEPAGDGFQASVHGYGFSTEPQFGADEFAEMCG
ncbi:hypothetical protein B0O41_3946 [Propionibacteriaceae bacterium ES.041]|nr:hypothetical protein B0O41_3946 [Propionibacteriaceae bacterium ES.041]